MDIKKENQRVAAKHLERLRAVIDESSASILDRQLKARGIDQHNIQLEQFHQLIVLIKPHQPDITLRLFQCLTLSDFGLYGYACASAVTLQEAIQHSIKFMPLSAVRYQEKEEIDTRWVHIYPVVLPDFLDQVIDIDEDFAAGNYSLLKDLLGDNFDWNMVEIHFSHNRPDYGRAYDDIFQCRVKFEQPKTLIRYPVSWLTKPISTNDSSLAEVCVSRCFELLNESDRKTPWSDKIRRLIIESRFEIITLEHAAKKLHIMPRTLREYLYREKESFRRLLLEVRMTLARQYLKSTTMSGEEISYLLKYSQPSVFFRAFEKYFGKTTRQLRSLFASK
ncbi:MAG: AraC family transcriptional regulator ligand-binding domain-containing protein [Colwellia sp.]|jgi:AraC-type DNA-binding domain-containing proteins